MFELCQASTSHRSVLGVFLFLGGIDDWMKIKINNPVPATSGDSLGLDKVGLYAWLLPYV